jgi:NADPH2:quinone reductase
MHAIRVHELGGPEQLRWEEVELGHPEEGEARVRHTAIGVNFIDTYHRTGLYPLPALPHGIGMEAVGIVEAVGTKVSEVRPGQRVGYAGGPPGSYAEERNYPARRLIPLPDDVEDITAAAGLLKGMTAEYLVRRVTDVGPDTVALVHAAAGGVGTILCAWLKCVGATVVGVVSTERKAAKAWANGCERVIVTEKDNFVEKCRELHPSGVDVVYDSVGRATFDGSVECLKKRGMLVGFGNASGPPDLLDPLTLARKGSLFLTRPTLFDYIETREELLESADAFFDVVRKGAVRVHVGATRPLKDAAAAHKALENRETTGSTVLLP